MNTFKFLSALVLLMPLICLSQINKNEVKTASSVNIEVYYFHHTARCVTCKTVEAETKQNIETLYPEFVKEGSLNFKSLNLEEDPGKQMAKKLRISGQTLIVVKGTKKINLTNEGFLYACTNPKKFKSIIKEKVDSLLNE